MRYRLAVLSLCALAMAGCQTLGGVQSSAPGAGAQPAAEGSHSAAAPSPWDAARARGMVFRAVGSDPGWSAEVDKSRTVFVELQASQRRIEVANAAISSDQAKGMVAFRGNASDGTPVALTIHRGQCEADMRGQKSAAAVELDVGPSQYKGCGRFLIQ